VRAGVSTPKSSSWFDEHPKLQRHFSRKTLEVVIMADLTQIHSYLEVLNGITGIIYNDGGVVTSSTVC
jgi:hypothetical protein